LETKAEMRGSRAITIRDLVKCSLRHTPKRLIIGEVRGAEAFDLLDSIDTGHAGTLATIHAGHPITALSRLFGLARRASEAETMPWDVLGQMVAGAFDVVVQMGRDDSRRVVTEIARPKWNGTGFSVEPVEIARAAGG
jgi:pilus assembly protein CpaF